MRRVSSAESPPAHKTRTGRALAQQEIKDIVGFLREGCDVDAIASDFDVLPRTILAIKVGGQRTFKSILDYVLELHKQKSADYGSPGDPYANIREAAEFGVNPLTRCIIDIADRLARYKAYVRNGKLENESLWELFRDVAVYALIAMVLIREEDVSDGSS